MTLFPGAAKYFKVIFSLIDKLHIQKEAEEELSHAHQIEEYLIKRGTYPAVQTITLAKHNWQAPLDVFQLAFQAECENRESLEKLVLLAKAEGDELTAQEILKMLDEQVSSCNEYEVLLNKAKAYTSLPGLFYHLDMELKKAAKK